MPLNAQITPNYAIVSDDAARNFIVKERRTVDPTKAPSYKAVEGAPAPALSERWVDAAYYPVSTEGLRGALDYVRFKSAVGADATSIAEFIALLQAETLRITSALESAVDTWPEIRVETALKQRAISVDKLGGVLAEG
ncbi:hypothetical protein G5B47_02445 [Paenibacillus sp. 7124]|uniref:Uncharacterized protein n=1 Tax=Paenibacillus apii TaxID=1850370 RepID=A0A6M1PFZ8_9BACL|nr:hypothetical protein [Paenibacillus apii]NGM81268.1 hypothetical protein [Paenibacillus apii]